MSMWKLERMLLKVVVLLLISCTTLLAQTAAIGSEQAVPVHLKDGDEFTSTLAQLLSYGGLLFNARFTFQDGAGSPLSKGTGAPLSGTQVLRWCSRGTLIACLRPRPMPALAATMLPRAGQAAIASPRFSFWGSGLTVLRLTTVTLSHCEEPSMNQGALSRCKTRPMSEKPMA
jgi:hypothetical protein